MKPRVGLRRRAGHRRHRPPDLALDQGKRRGTIECVTGVWGFSGWLVFLVIPLAFWTFLVALLVLVFRSGPSVEAEAEAEVPVIEPVRALARDRSALGWLPPVAPHH